MSNTGGACLGVSSVIVTCVAALSYRLEGTSPEQQVVVARFAAMLFEQRLRTKADRQHVCELYAATMRQSILDRGHCDVAISPDALLIGQAAVSRLLPADIGGCG